MRIAVTGATGRLGSLVLDRLLDTAHADQLVGVVRSTEKATNLAARGVETRRGDYSEPHTLEPALAGVNRLLLVSGSDLGNRVVQHRVVIEAAKAASVELVVYTSVLRADTSTLPSAGEHQQTEELLRGSGIPHVILRNGWYIENYTERLAASIAQGAFLGSAGAGRIAAASRADYAAAVLTTDGHQGKTYELAGDESFSMAELAAAVSGWAGKCLPYKDLPPAGYRQALMKTGLPEAIVELLVATDHAIARGDLASNRRDLHELIGRETQRLSALLAALPRPQRPAA
jgi:NAD(P)H dehydrogenase (quinone)